MKRILALTLTTALLTGCATVEDKPASTSKADFNNPQAEFMGSLMEMCGKSFEGKVISNDEADADWRAETLVMHVRNCSMREVKIPLHVGENRSRTWVVSKTDTGLRLKHDHRHEDGTSDAVTMYGGDTVSSGSATQQSFPADAYSKDLFKREFLTASVDNVWSISIDPGKTFTYSLTRPERDFRAQFDLTKPVKTPPPVWGYGDAERAPNSP